MLKFISGFFTATIIFSILLYTVKMPEYITYDCSRIESYESVPEHVIKACARIEQRDKQKWLRV